MLFPDDISSQISNTTSPAETGKHLLTQSSWGWREKNIHAVKSAYQGEQHKNVKLTALGFSCPSVIVFGTVTPASDKLASLELISAKYSPDFKEQGKKHAKAAESNVAVYELQILEFAGKARKS